MMAAIMVGVLAVTLGATVTTAQSMSPIAVRPPAIVDDSGEMAADAAKVRELLRQKRFSDLEALAKNWTETRAKNPSGSWRVEAFLSGTIPEDSVKEPSPWEACQELHAAWRAKEPSPWQVVAEANFWLSYGWKERGRGYAETVTPEGWRLLVERGKRAEALMTKHWELISDLPAAHAVMGRLALSFGYPRPQRDRLLADALDRWPDYNGFYFSYAMYILPRWYGHPGELEEWAWKVSEGRPEDWRHEIYARIAWSLTSTHKLVMKETGMEWPKIRSGFEVLREKWPASGHILNRYARFAWQANDRQTARVLLEFIGDEPVMSAWGTREVFEKFRLWAGNARNGSEQANGTNRRGRVGPGVDPEPTAPPKEKANDEQIENK